MNERIKELIKEATSIEYGVDNGFDMVIFDKEKFSKLIIESVLDEVKERAYYTGDRDWSDEVDRPWIQLEFGYGKLHNAKTSGS